MRLKFFLLKKMGEGRVFQEIEVYFFILKSEKQFSFEIQSTLDISKSKFIPNYLYFKITFMVPDNLLSDITV